MLYNPNWNKVDPLSLKAFADWLEAQPPAKEYVYILSDRCAWAQFSKQNIGIIKSVEIRMTVLPRPWTFGAAAVRARTILARGIYG